MGIIKGIQQGMVKCLALATAWSHSHILKGRGGGRIAQNTEGENSEAMCEAAVHLVDG